jgi:hypothetical protein
LVDPARKIRIGNKLFFTEDESLVAEVIDNTTSRGRTLRFLFDGSYEEFRAKLKNWRNSASKIHQKRRRTGRCRKIPNHLCKSRRCGSSTNCRFHFSNI